MAAEHLSSVLITYHPVDVLSPFAAVRLTSIAGLTYASPVFVSAVITAGLGIIAWRYPRRPGRRPFILLMASVTIWSGAYGFGLVIASPTWRVFFEQFQWIGIAFVPVWWAVFAFDYAGLDQLVTRRTVTALSVIPLVTIAMVFSNPAHRLFWRTNRLVVAHDVVVMAQEFGPWYFVNLVFAYSLFGVGAIILLRLAFTYDSLYMDQSVALTVGAVVPFIGNVVSNLGLAPLPGLDLTPFTFAVTGLGFGLAMYRFELFGLLPMTRQIGRDMAMANLKDGVVIVDAEGHVVDANRAAWGALGRDREAIIGEPFGRLFGDPQLSTPQDLPDDVGFGTDRLFELSVSAIHDGHDRLIGHAIVLRDVTEQRLREQRLKVQNRVLRHNLRNEVNVIQGNVELIAEEASASVGESIDRINSAVESLIGLSHRASDVETVTERDFDPKSVDVTELVTRIAEETKRDFPDTRIEVDIPAGLSVRTHIPVLEVVLEQLFRNAAEHVTDAAPEIRIGATTRSGLIELAVSDNGPGIPDIEVGVLDAEAETPLYHGSGMGLWVVKWGARRLGGEVTFETEAEGAVAKLTIPDLNPNDRTVGIDQVHRPSTASTGVDLVDD